MDDALIVVTKSFLTQCWRLFKSWDLPGTNITPAELLLGFLVAILAFRFILSLFHKEDVSFLSSHDFTRNSNHDS